MIDLVSYKLIELAYLEDSITSDVTSLLTIADKTTSRARFIAKEPIVLAGMPFVLEVFSYLSKDCSWVLYAEEGQEVGAKDTIAEVEGDTKTLLRAERIGLNILQRLSGIATLTREYVNKVRDLPVRIVDTRKTTPGMRAMEKYAVRMGGGYNHRFGLYDGILIKDNHIKATGSISKALELAKKGHHLLKVEVEVSSIQQVQDALDAGADVIMLDNMTIDEMAEAVKRINKRALVEASGGVTLQNVRDIALTGVDLISIGAITHSARAVDISMKFV